MSSSAEPSPSESEPAEARPPKWQTGLLVVQLLLFAVIGYLYWQSGRQETPAAASAAEEFVVPEHTKVALAWQNLLTGQKTLAPLPVRPGDTLRLEVASTAPPEATTLDAVTRQLLKAPEAGAEPALPVPELAGRVTLVAQDQPAAAPPRFQFRFLPASSEFAARLREQEQLAALVADAPDEFGRFLKLTVWVRDQCPAGKPDPYPAWNALEILALMRSGRSKAFCGQHSQVLVQCLSALGYPARYLGVRQHEQVEVWSNQYAKWIVLDPFFGCYYRRANGGEPLGALEIRRLVLAARTAEIEQVKLRDDTGTDAARELARFAELNVSIVNDHPLRPRGGIEDLDDIWKQRVIWLDQHSTRSPLHDGHLRLYTFIANDLWFSLQGVQVRLTQVGPATLKVTLTSQMPERARFEIADADGWAETPATFAWPLAPGDNLLRVRAVSTSGIAGPPSRVQVNRGQ